LTPVRVTPKADADIVSIASFIAQDSVPRALQFIDNIRDGCAKLAIFPKRGRARPEYGARVRSFPAPPVVVFYSVASDESEVVVLRVIVGGRDLETIF
jgi:toxin ParE1/3/4